VAPGAISRVGTKALGKTTLTFHPGHPAVAGHRSRQVLGLDVSGVARLKERINLAASGAHFLWCMTVSDQPQVYGRALRVGRPDLDGQGGKAPGLIRAGGTPGGYFERLSPASSSVSPWRRPSINDPSLLFLDEPTSGLDQGMAHHIRQEILRLNRETGVTMS